MSTAPKIERRKLRFANLDEIVADAENLLEKGYDRTRNWDLSQVCLHLADWMRFPMDGFPKPPVFIRIMMWMARNTVGPKMLRNVLADGMECGRPTMPETVKQPGDPAAAVRKLKETVERFKAYDGPIHPSPLFGAMNKDVATRLQLVHAAHHLGFLVPRQW